MDYFLTQAEDGQWWVNVDNDAQIKGFKTLAGALKFIDQTEADS